MAFELLARKAWSRRDLEARLRRRGAPAAVAAAVVADLEARGHVDDRAYAASWVDARARGRGLGSRRLRDELLARGVARPLIEAALRRMDGADDEEARARAVAARRLPALRRAGPASAAPRLYAYLLRRGFPGGLARRVVRDACGIALASVEE